MSRRKSSQWLDWSAWFDTAARSSQQWQRMTRDTLVDQATRMQRSTERLMSGVVTPAQPPGTRGTGQWQQGRWGIGPLALRDYRLFIPAGVSASRPAPLLVLLHGCGQDSASFAACSQVATLARSEKVAVLMPEQSSQASPQRCWSWFGAESRVATEALILMAIIEQVCMLYPVRRDRLFAFGISAGGAMALSLALRYPDRFRAVGSHSGAVPHSALNAVQAGQVMRGRGRPRLDALRLRLLGARLPPMLVLHGSRDRVVAPANADASARLWLDLLAEQPKPDSGTVRRGQRYPYTRTDWKVAGKPYVRQLVVQGLGHAWSGGSTHQAFADPKGPDALKLAWRFFQESTGRTVTRKSAKKIPA